jgi:2-methylaconitate cis-trans-isomerase PrpF
MRGGTSRGLVIEADALPGAVAERQRVVAELFGAGHPAQLDGLGGARPHTSKVAVVGRSRDDGADIDYHFGQVGIDRATVDFSGTCGNMASAVALYAVEERWVPAGAPVRIRDVSSGAVLTCRVGGDADATTEPAMPASGVPVAVDLAGLQGGATGSVLPTGHGRDRLRSPDGTAVPATIVDVGNVLAFVPAEALGLTGHEAPEAIESSPVVATLEHLRGAVAALLGWCATPEEWHTRDTRLPFVALLAEPTADRPAGDSDGGPADLTLRLWAVGRIHPSIAVTVVGACGAGAVATGSVVADALSRPLSPDETERRLRIAHPGGIADLTLAITRSESGASATGLRYLRTARRLMEGTAFPLQ